MYALIHCPGTQEQREKAIKVLINLIKQNSRRTGLTDLINYERIVNQAIFYIASIGELQLCKVD